MMGVFHQQLLDSLLQPAFRPVQELIVTSKTRRWGLLESELCSSQV